MTARRGNLLGFLACICLLAYAYDKKIEVTYEKIRLYEMLK